MAKIQSTATIETIQRIEKEKYLHSDKFLQKVDVYINDQQKELNKKPLKTIKKQKLRHQFNSITKEHIFTLNDDLCLSGNLAYQLYVNIINSGSIQDRKSSLRAYKSQINKKLGIEAIILDKKSNLYILNKKIIEWRD